MMVGWYLYEGERDRDIYRYRSISLCLPSFGFKGVCKVDLCSKIKYSSPLVAISIGHYQHLLHKEHL